MQILGFQPDSIALFKDYLSGRSQVLNMDGAFSNSLHVGANSVIHVMSCALYLIYILNLPVLFQSSTQTEENNTHTQSHTLTSSHTLHQHACTCGHPSHWSTGHHNTHTITFTNSHFHPDRSSSPSFHPRSR